MNIVSPFVTPVIDIISRLWSCSAAQSNYLCDLKQNLNALESSFMKLKDRRDDVKARVHIAESNPTDPARRTHEVRGWLQRVETLEQQIENILQEGIKNGGKYFCCWGRKNCCSGYKLGKVVVEKLNDADKLWNEGVFQVLVTISQPDVVREISVYQALGMDQMIDEVWSLLVDEQSTVRIIGLYGMGGVGKTTLLKKLNNEFLKRNHHFDLVIWVVVSKDLNIKTVQKQISKSLGLTWGDETNIDDRAKDINQVLKNKKFALFLDDIWDRVDLQKVGIPYVKITNQELTKKSRVVFTTRSEFVCGLMQADEIVKVNCLDWDKSWRLFQQNVGQRVLSSHNVTELAEKVAKECLGLPLALIAIGQTMACKKTVQEWQHAVTVLQKSASEFQGMVDEVLAILKFSFDSLQNEKLKSCLLYCSLYPDDYSIRRVELIRLWIGEGFLDEVDDIDEAYNEGHDVIESLKSACLLESGNDRNGNEVKMHDVVRDLALWISSDLGRKKGNYLTIQAQNKLKLHEWEKAVKISVVNNRSIKELNGAPNCLNLSTLRLHGSKVETISDDFFQSMPMLKVLDMSDLLIEKLPISIFTLTELHYLDLSCDNIGFGATKLSPGTLVRLTKLRMLDLFGSDLSNWEIEGGPSLSELECLKDLNYLGISLETVLALQRLVSSHKLQLCTKLLKVYKCQGIETLVLSPSFFPTSPASSLVSLANMVSLKTLHLQWCRELEELRIVSWVSMEDKLTLFATLEKFKIWQMPKLKIVWDVPQRSTFSFMNLKDVSIWHCPKLKNLTWLIYAQNLETLDLQQLNGLEDVISDGFEAEENLLNTFPRLNSLFLGSMSKLKRICNKSVKFLSLEHFQVRYCPRLKKLPFDANSVIIKTLMIQASKEWWESLEWEDETTKYNLARHNRFY